MTGLVDLHAHFLPGVDDGPRELAESLAIVRGLQALGYGCLVATPHARPGLFDPDGPALLAALTELRGALGPLEPRVFLAGEHYLDDVIWTRIAEHRGRPYPNGRAILVEIPTSGPAPARLADQLFRLRVGGLRPVMAHPERISAFQEDPALVEALHAAGIPMAADLTSLVGGGGRHARRTLEKFLEHSLIDVACTDIHSADELPDVEKALARLRKLCGSELFDRLVRDGPARLALFDERTEAPAACS
jgi:protein-tyrosine phosphatase